MTDYTPHQQKIIKRYYEHHEELLLARLSEIVTELYLAETDAKRDRLWDRAAKAIEGLKIPPSLAQHILTRRDPEVLAHNLKHWLAAGKQKGQGQRMKDGG